MRCISPRAPRRPELLRRLQRGFSRNGASGWETCGLRRLIWIILRSRLQADPLSSSMKRVDNPLVVSCLRSGVHDDSGDDSFWHNAADQPWLPRSWCFRAATWPLRCIVSDRKNGSSRLRPASGRDLRHQGICPVPPRHINIRQEPYSMRLLSRQGEGEAPSDGSRAQQPYDLFVIGGGINQARRSPATRPGAACRSPWPRSATSRRAPPRRSSS